MYSPTDSFLQLLYSILTHDRKALSFALVSCEDSVLFFQSHFISVHFGAGLFFFISALQEFQMKNRISPSIQTSIPMLSAVTTSLARPSFSRSFLPSWAIPNVAQCPYRQYCSRVCVWFSRHLAAPQDLAPISPMSPSSPYCTKSVSCKDMKLKTSRHPQIPWLLHLPTFSNGSGCAEKAHGDQYWEHSCAGTDAEGAEGVWCLQTLRQTGTLRAGKEVTPFRILNLRNVWNHTEPVCIYSFDPRCCTWK